MKVRASSQVSFSFNIIWKYLPSTTSSNTKSTLGPRVLPKLPQKGTVSTLRLHISCENEVVVEWLSCCSLQWHCGRLTPYTTRLWISPAFLQRSSRSPRQPATPHRRLLWPTGLSWQTCPRNRSRLNSPRNLENFHRSRSSPTSLLNLSWETCRPNPSSKTSPPSLTSRTSPPNLERSSLLPGRLPGRRRGLRRNLRPHLKPNLSLNLSLSLTLSLKTHHRLISRQI